MQMKEFYIKKFQKSIMIMQSFSYRLRENGRFDTKLYQQLTEEKQYWTAVLTKLK